MIGLLRFIRAALGLLFVIQCLHLIQAIPLYGQHPLDSKFTFIIVLKIIIGTVCLFGYIKLRTVINDMHQKGNLGSPEKIKSFVSL